MKAQSSFLGRIPARVGERALRGDDAGQRSTTVNETLSLVHRANFSIIVTAVDTRAKGVCYVNILR